MHQNGLSGMYLGFELCQIQWHRFQVSTISHSCEIKILGKNLTFCWFWLGKMHHNGLSGMYLGFEVCQIQWHLFQVSTISNSWKIKNFRQKFHILLILTGKNASKWLEWHVFRVWGVPNPMAQVSSIYDKWFLRNQNFRQKFHILLILTEKNASKWLEWHIFRVWGVSNPMAQVSSIYNKQVPEKSKFQAKISHFVDFDWEKCIIMAWVACI